MAGEGDAWPKGEFTHPGNGLLARPRGIPGKPRSARGAAVKPELKTLLNSLRGVL